VRFFASINRSSRLLLNLGEGVGINGARADMIDRFLAGLCSKQTIARGHLFLPRVAGNFQRSGAVLEAKAANKNQTAAIMGIYQPLLFSAAALALSTLPSHAGPCSREIIRAQARVDAKVHEIARTGPSTPEGLIALLHQQPTPSSIATAESKLGKGSQMEDAVAALARARETDRADDESACERALEDAEREIGSLDVAQIVPRSTLQAAACGRPRKGVIQWRVPRTQARDVATEGAVTMKRHPTQVCHGKWDFI